MEVFVGMVLFMGFELVWYGFWEFCFEFVILLRVFIVLIRVLVVLIFNVGRGWVGGWGLLWV